MSFRDEMHEIALHYNKDSYEQLKDETRLKLHKKLYDMYENLGFNVVEVGGTYNERLNFILTAIKEILK